MSLIQEALKRQQQEFGDGKTATPPPATNPEPPVTETMPVTDAPLSVTETPAPDVPSPAVPPPLPASARSSRPKLMISGLVAMGLVILVVGGFLAAKWTLKIARKTAIPALAAQPMPVQPGSDIAPANGKDSGTAAPQTVAGTEPAASIPVVPPATSSQISVASAPLSDVSRESMSAGPQVADQAVKTDARPKEKPPLAKVAPAPIQWPTLKLTGILASISAGEGAARINNQMIFVGGQIEDVTLVEIRSDGVLLKYGGETKFLKMGGTLY